MCLVTLFNSVDSLSVFKQFMPEGALSIWPDHPVFGTRSGWQCNSKLDWTGESPTFTARCHASTVLAMGLCPSVTSRSSTKTAKRRITVQSVGTSRSRSGLRSSSTSSMDYSLPRLRTKFGERAFSHAGPATWNSLPDHIRTVVDPVKFRKLLKNHTILVELHLHCESKKNKTRNSCP